MKIFAFIPAKKNSKRLPNKNLRKIKGKTLIDITINNAKKINLIDEIYVSTNSKKIIQISKSLNCKTIIRPEKLCTEKANMNNVIYHFINHLNKNGEKQNFLILLLQVTSPLRESRDIVNAFKMMKKYKHSGIISVNKVDSSVLKSLIIKKNKMMPLNEKYLTANDQFLPKVYKPNGSIYIFSKKDFLVKKKIPIKKMKPFIVNGISNLDINYEDDLKIAKKFMKN